MRRTRGELKFRRLAVVFALACVAFVLADRATAAPLSPAVQFAYNVAANSYWKGNTGCEQVDAQIVPSFGSPEIVGEYGPCYVYVNRELAGSFYFAKVCKMLVNVIGSWHGRPVPVTSPLPRTCFMHDLFLMNHPDYLRQRFS